MASVMSMKTRVLEIVCQERQDAVTNPWVVRPAEGIDIEEQVPATHDEQLFGGLLVRAAHAYKFIPELEIGFLILGDRS